jgi:sterol desaturase/sphingolipid hydroxylase (fatty acid hydroxylase superfamily)
MISQSSLYNFITINTILILLALFQNNFCIFIKNEFIIYLFFIFRNYFLMNFIEYGTRDKPFINNTTQGRPIPTYKYEFDINIWRTTSIETITYFYTKSYIKTYSYPSFIYEIAFFIPTSFLFEIIFDFFHYFAHRLLHHSMIYKYVHKMHHKFKHPSVITTFYQDPADLIITNSIPTMLALSFISHTNFQYHLITIYKTFVEISGHSGKHSYPTCSFTQCIWIPKSIGIELYTENHDLHHSENNCNYGKRFSLWDKIFGTYKI